MGDTDTPEKINSIRESGLIVKTKEDVNYFNNSNLKQKQASISLPFGGKVFSVGNGNTFITSTDLVGTRITQLSSTGDVNMSSLQDCTPFCRSCTVIGGGFENNDGNIQLVGQINEQHEEGYFTTIVVMELDNALNYLGESKIPLSSNKKIISAIPTFDDGIVILTSSIINSCINSSYTVLKLNKNNEVEWEKCLENLPIGRLRHSDAIVEISEFEDEFLITYLDKESITIRPFILFLDKKSREIEIASLPFNSVSDIWTIDDKIYIASEINIFFSYQEA